MTKPRGATRAWLLAAALTTCTAMSVRPNPLFERDGTCGDPSLARCTQAGFPDNFCCPTGSSCIALAGDTTILCCPSGDDCSVIAPIVCNIQLQNATSNPDASVKTTFLTGTLPSCGANCCPFGYTCDQDGNCVKDQDQSHKPTGVTAGASASASTTASSTPVSTPAESTATAASSHGSGVTSTAAPASETPDATTSNSFPTTAVVGGVVGGVVGIIAIVAAFLIFRHHRKQREEQQMRRRSTTSSFGNLTGFISAPMAHKQYPGDRTDFLGGKPSAASTPSQAQERFDDGSYSPHSNPRNGAGDGRFDDDHRSHHASAMIPPIRGLRTSQHGGRDRRRPSSGSESIAVFADSLTVNDARRFSNATTWSFMQKKAGQPK